MNMDDIIYQWLIDEGFDKTFNVERGSLNPLLVSGYIIPRESSDRRIQTKLLWQANGGPEAFFAFSSLYNIVDKNFYVFNIFNEEEGYVELNPCDPNFFDDIRKYLKLCVPLLKNKSKT